jgi:hypothetical protein
MPLLIVFTNLYYRLTWLVLLGSSFIFLPVIPSAQTQTVLLPVSTATPFSESNTDSVFLKLKEKMLVHRQNQHKTEEAICLQQRGRSA